MVQKKSNRSNLENKRVLFFEYGLVVALACSLLAFEWGTDVQITDDLALNGGETYIPEEMTIITKPERPKPKPPIVPDEVIVINDDEPNIDVPDIDWGQDINGNTEIDLYIWEPDEERVKEPEIFVKVEKMPTYKGGDHAAFQKHVQQLVRYPAKAQELNVQGKVIVRFVIDENGKLVEPKVLQSADPLLSNAVLTALQKTGKWKAGEQRGRKVKVSFTIPIFFRLN